MDAAQLSRWEQIKRDFMRDKAMGGDDADTGARVVAQLADIASGLQGLRVDEVPVAAPVAAAVEAPWEQIVALLQAVAERPAPVVAPVEAPIAQAPPQDFEPLLRALADSQQRQGQIGRASCRESRC